VSISKLMKSSGDLPTLKVALQELNQTKEMISKAQKVRLVEARKLSVMGRLSRALEGLSFSHAHNVSAREMIQAFEDIIYNVRAVRKIIDETKKIGRDGGINDGYTCSGLLPEPEPKISAEGYTRHTNQVNEADYKGGR
jgi:hypothetical protein